jgi:nucleobase:cation symporter-1, NCS1 family
VTPNLPGFIQTINSSINVKNGIRLFDIAWLLGFSPTFVTYAVINRIWPALETMVPKAILPDGVYSQETDHSPRKLSEGEYFMQNKTFAI